MSNKNQKPNTIDTNSGLANAVLDRIEKDRIAPTPQWQFLFHESFMWGLWVASVLIGAVAVSVMIFVSLSAGYSFYEATHESELSFFIEVLPYIWILTFVAMIGLAYFNIRHTKKGYRYPLWQLVISSLLLSLFGGALLHNAGLGYLIDNEISQNAPMFRSLSRIEAQMWQAPEKGRMLGVLETEGGVFTAVDGTEWKIDTTELMARDLELLQSGEQVRVIGMIATSAEPYFYGCAVVPWMFEKPMPISELRAERDIFMERLQHHAERLKNNGEEKLESIGFVSEGDDDLPATVTTETEPMHCPKMPLVKRLILAPVR